MENNKFRVIAGLVIACLTLSGGMTMIIQPPFVEEEVSLYSFSDDFNRSNGPIGSSWTEVSGNGYSISSNICYSDGGSNNIAVLSDTPSIANGTLICDVSPGGSAFTDASILFRYTDSSNYYEFVIEDNIGGTGNDFGIVKVVGGSATLVAYWSSSANYSSTYELKVIYNGTSIQGYVDGTLRINTTDSAHSTGNVGIRTDRGTASGTFNDFSIVES